MNEARVPLSAPSVNINIDTVIADTLPALIFLIDQNEVEQAKDLMISLVRVRKGVFVEHSKAKRSALAARLSSQIESALLRKGWTPPPSQPDTKPSESEN